MQFYVHAIIFKLPLLHIR